MSSRMNFIRSIMDSSPMLEIRRHEMEGSPLEFLVFFQPCCSQRVLLQASTPCLNEAG